MGKKYREYTKKAFWPERWETAVKDRETGNKGKRYRW